MRISTSLFLLLLLVPGCFSRCPLADEAIGEVSGDLDATIARILDETSAAPPGEAYAENLVVGDCANGPIFAFRFIGPFTWQYDYFDPTSHEFLSLTRGYADVPPIPCTGAGFWPRDTRCIAPVITEVVSGTRYSVGDGEEVLPSR